MDIAVILLVIALVLAIVSLFVHPHQFNLLAAAVIIAIVAVLLTATGVVVD